MPEIPITLSIDDKDRPKYDEKLEAEALFASRQNKDRFLLAMAFGFRNKARKALSSKYSFVRTEYVKPEDDTLMDAIAFAETKSVETLADRAKVYQIAEEYAHAGIDYLLDWIKAQPYGTTERRFELELSEACGAVKSDDSEANSPG